jgi:hypothetical protein
MIEIIMDKYYWKKSREMLLAYFDIKIRDDVHKYCMIFANEDKVVQYVKEQIKIETSIFCKAFECIPSNNFFKSNDILFILSMSFLGRNNYFEYNYLHCPFLIYEKISKIRKHNFFGILSIYDDGCPYSEFSVLLSNNSNTIEQRFEDIKHRYDYGTDFETIIIPTDEIQIYNKN